MKSDHAPVLSRLRSGLRRPGLLQRTTNMLAQTMAFLGILALPVFSVPSGSAQAASPWVADDFSTDSGSWEYLGSAFRDAVNENAVLTETTPWQAGVIWLVDEIKDPFVIEFTYRAGGGSGADGLVFMFYKDTEYVPAAGGYLAFCDEPPQYPAPELICSPGYGIEFDNWKNSGSDFGEGFPPDPSANHLAVIEDHIGNHVAHVDDARTEDNLWHHVRVEVGVDSVTVTVGGGQVLAWEGFLDRTYGGLGFGGGTGQATNDHVVDDVSIFVSPPDGDIPATSVVGLALLLLAVLGSGVYFMRRRVD